MAGSSRQSLPSWITAAAATTTTTRVDIEGINKEGSPKNEESKSVPSASDFDLGFAERAFAAAGAAVLSAVIVNPLDVAKTRLQAQAAGVPYQGLCGTASFESNTMFPCVKSSSHGVPARHHSFKTRTGGLTRDPVDPGMEPVRVEIKTRLGIVRFRM